MATLGARDYVAPVPNSPTIAGGAPPQIDRSRPLAWATGVRGISRATWVRAGILAFFCAFYVWTVASSVPISFKSGADGLYGQMADAFLHGHVALRDAPPELTSLPNPYDPKKNGVSPLDPNHDLSLYHGKLYAYWGPAPAVLLFAPARLLGIAFSQAVAIILFAFLGLVFSVLTLLTLQRRFAPRAAAWKVNAGIILLGFANVVPYTIRRPDKYEVAITAGFCFAMLGTWLLLSTLLREDKQPPSLRRLAFGSLALGLAVGARPSHAVTAAGLIALSVWLLRGTSRERRLRTAVALLGPIAACGVVLALYNYVRFDSFTEFGLSYQLAGVDVTARDTFSLSYLLPGLWYYLAAPPRLVLIYPFVELAKEPLYPGHVPKVYDGVEPTGGILALAPLVFILFAVVPFRRRFAPELRAVLLTFALIALGLVLVAAVAFWGTTMRYEVDFASFLLLAALVVWMRSQRRWVTIAGVAAIAWGSFAGAAVSMTGEDDLLYHAHPKLWNALVRDFSPVSRLGAQVTRGGPTIAKVYGDGPDPAGRNYTTFDDQGMHVLMSPRPIKLTIVMPSAGPVHLKMTVKRGPGVQRGTGLNLMILLPDGRVGTIPLTKPKEPVDLSFSLPRGVQHVELVTQPEAPPTQLLISQLYNLRIESGQ